MRTRIVLGAVGVLGFLGMLVIALGLLNQGKIGGPEFVALVVSFAVLGAVVGFSPEIQEFSVAGNVVKLREIKNEVVEAVKGLERTRTELLRSMIREFSKGGTSQDSMEGERNLEFWALIDLSRQFGSFADLRKELIDSIYVLTFAERHRLNATIRSFGYDSNALMRLSLVEYTMFICRPDVKEDIVKCGGVVRYDGTDVDKQIEKVLAELGKFEKLKSDIEAA